MSPLRRIESEVDALPDAEKRELLRYLQARVPAAPAPKANGAARFREVVPLRLNGTPASEILLRDRR